MDFKIFSNLTPDGDRREGRAGGLGWQSAKVRVERRGGEGGLGAGHGRGSDGRRR